MFKLEFTDEAKASLTHLKNSKTLAIQYKAVIKALKQLQADPHHPGLNSKPFQSLKGPNGEKVFESYAQHRTPGAYRLFWYYHPDEKKIIVILNIVRHP
ncbi:type II toxin-antitoxin system RelE/ParE family toxin [Candidatus Neomarinimicrobiota bacterium]